MHGRVCWVGRLNGHSASGSETQPESAPAASCLSRKAVSHTKRRLDIFRAHA